MASAPNALQARLVFTLATLAVVMAHTANAITNSLPDNLPWDEDIAVLAARAMADARSAAAAAPATTTGFVVARKEVAREVVASATDLASRANPTLSPTSTPFADAALHKLTDLAHNRVALFVGCSIALALLLTIIAFICCRRHRRRAVADTPTTPFADRATSLPPSKGRRRSYKTLHD